MPPVHPDADAPGGVVDAMSVTQLLVAWRGGAQGALDRLFPLVYDELRRIAQRQLASERSGHTLSTTALVHEAYLRLVDQTRAQWVDRAQFYAVAARAMRRILVDHARRHRAAKRGGGRRRVSLDLADLSEPTTAGGTGAGAVAAVDASVADDDRAEVLIALDEALARLAESDDRLSRLVECRFFGGLTEEETAAVLGVTARTVRRDWVKAKAWLYRAMQE
jgi:RNA polymerase sigma factor (TIGR02999 family)